MFKYKKMIKKEHILFRLSKDEKRELKQRADKLHISMSGYIRMKTLYKYEK